MSTRRPRRGEVGRLLRESLDDHPPREVEERLRAGMRSFWPTASAEAPSAARNAGLDGRSAARLGEAWGPVRAALAAAAVVMLAVGWVIHLEADTGPAAESLLAQQTAFRVAFALGRVSSMECRLETHDARGRPVRFDIDWRRRGQARVRVEGPEGIRDRTLHVPRPPASVLLLVHEESRHSPPSAIDPELAPARDHLTPAGVMSLLAGKWERIPPAPGAPPGVVEYRVSQTGRPVPVRVTIDGETSLPLSLEPFGSGEGPRSAKQTPRARARFVWDSVPPSTEPLEGRPWSEASSGRSVWS